VKEEQAKICHNYYHIQFMEQTLKTTFKRIFDNI
jgi:hypothetical protein